MSLYHRIRNVMTKDVVSIDVDAPVSQARQLLLSRPFHHLPVVQNTRLVGMLSLVDIYRVSLEGWVPDDATLDAWLDSTFTLKGVMSHDPESVRGDLTAREAAQLLAGGSFHALAVVDDDGVLEGILTTTDLLRLVLSAG